MEETRYDLFFLGCACFKKEHRLPNSRKWLKGADVANAPRLSLRQEHCQASTSSDGYSLRRSNPVTWLKSLRFRLDNTCVLVRMRCGTGMYRIVQVGS